MLCNAVGLIQNTEKCIDVTIYSVVKKCNIIICPKILLNFRTAYILINK